MEENTKRTLIVCITIFVTVSSIAWATVSASIWGKIDPREIEKTCLISENSSRPICIAEAERIKAPKP